MHVKLPICRYFVAALFCTLVACGGGGEDDPPAAPAPPPVVPPPPPALPGTVIGTAGGTVMGPQGASVVIPAGALATDTRIHLEQTSIGAPALPPGIPSGQMFAFTPHGTQFALPVTITLPFDPASVPSGNVPALYKTNDLGEFVRLSNVDFFATSVSARVTSFSRAQVIIEPLTPDQLLRTVSFEPTVGNNEALSDDEGELDERRLVGPPGLFEIPFDGDNTSALEAYSSADAVPFWVASESGKGNVRLNLDRSFIKELDNATLEIVITRGLLEALDFNGVPAFDECPNGVSKSTCNLLSASVLFSTEMTRVTADGEDFVYRADAGEREFGEDEDPEADVPVLDTGGHLILKGQMGQWSGHFFKEWDRTTSPFNAQNVETTEDVNGDPAKSHPRVRTLGQIVIPVDLSRVKRFERFWINTILVARTRNEREDESGIGAFLRDPVKIGGAAMQFTGLRPSGAPRPTPRVPRRPITCAAGIPDPQAGVLQFNDVDYRLLEGQSEEENLDIMITRSNGSQGTVSATVAFAGGTAISGLHYEPLSGTVIFADGESGPLFVGIETPQNDVAEADKTVTATLTSPGGCAVLGENNIATVTIIDDDSAPPPPPRFTVGGAVVGLIPSTGGNLVLENHTGLFLEITAAGPFTFSSLPSLAGIPYFVRVFNQPRNALGIQTQQCTVTNGSGFFVNANVNDVVVTCVDI